MSKIIKQGKVEQQKREALAAVDDYLNNLIRSNDDKKIKQTSLLSYWIKDYIKFLEKEETFEPGKLIKYTRGDIVKVHLGYGIGNEEGGLHYAVVVDKNNGKSSGIVTVIPLTSVRDKGTLHHAAVNIGTEIFTSIISKHDKLKNNLTIEFEKLQKDLIAQQAIENKLKELELLRRAILRMKKGSVALVNQITTISKIRIYDPIYQYNVLYGVRLQPTTLDKINDKIKELYIKT